MLRNYELMMVMTPQLDEDGIAATLERVGRYVSERGGTVVQQRRWGNVRRLAYPIRDFKEGTYVLTHLELDAQETGELEASVKASEDILRHLLVRIDEIPEPIEERPQTVTTEEAVAPVEAEATEEPVATVEAEPVATAEEPVAPVEAEATEEPVAAVEAEPVATAEEPVAAVDAEPVATAEEPVAAVDAEPVATAEEPAAAEEAEPVAAAVAGSADSDQAGDSEEQKE